MKLIELLTISIQISLSIALTLDKSSKDMKSINSSLYSKIANKTIRLQLNNNKIKSIKQKTFEPFTKLKYLNLNHNIIDYLSDESFTGLKDLKILSLKGNKIISLRVGLFNDLHQLKKLDLSDNFIKITGANNFPFYGLANLSELNLSGNKLSRIYSYTFAGLTKLNILNLKNANIKYISSKSFNKAFDLCLQRNITKIYLNNNPVVITDYIIDGKCFKIIQSKSLRTSLLRYGLAANDSIVPKGDDNYIGPLNLCLDFKYFGESYTSLYISTNGYISFEEPERFPSVLNSFIEHDPVSIIFPFFFDISTQISGNIYYREQFTDLNSIKNDVNLIDLDFNPKWAFIVTWDKVATVVGSSDSINSFQAILTTNGVESFVIFNYGDLMWSNSDFYSNKAKFNYAKAGFYSKNNYNFHFINSTRSNYDLINISNSSNVNLPGKFVFRVENTVDFANCTLKKAKVNSQRTDYE